MTIGRLIFNVGWTPLIGTAAILDWQAGKLDGLWMSFVCLVCLVHLIFGVAEYFGELYT